MAWPAAASTTARARQHRLGSGSRRPARCSSGARLTTLLLPGVGTIEELRRAWIRRPVGPHRHALHRADVAAQHIATAREIGMDVSGFLMLSHMAPARCWRSRRS